MISLTKNTKLKPEDVIKRAISFFGPKGYGLTIQEAGCLLRSHGGRRRRRKR